MLGEKRNYGVNQRVIIIIAWRKRCDPIVDSWFSSIYKKLANCLSISFLAIVWIKRKLTDDLYRRYEIIGLSKIKQGGT